MYVAIFVTIVVLIAIVALAIWYFSNKSSEADEEGVGGDGGPRRYEEYDYESTTKALPPASVLFSKGDTTTIHGTSPVFCSIADVLDKRGVLNGFDYANRGIVFELLKVIEIMFNDMLDHAAVRAVMRGMDINVDMLLEGIDREHLLGVLKILDVCLPELYSGVHIKLKRCELDHFGGTNEDAADLAAAILNKIRSNAIKYEDQFVFGVEPGANHDDIVKMRDVWLAHALRMIRDMPPVDPAKLLESDYA